MHSQVAKRDGAVIITLKGDLTIENAADIRNVFIDALIKRGKGLSILLTFDDVHSADASFIQLLYALHRDAAQMKRRFGLVEPVPEEIMNVMKTLGMSDAEPLPFLQGIDETISHIRRKQ